MDVQEPWGLIKLKKYREKFKRAESREGIKCSWSIFSCVYLLLNSCWKWKQELEGEVKSVVSQSQLLGEEKEMMKGRKYVTKHWSRNSEENFKRNYISAFNF